MARELAAKQLALFAENPRRYFLRSVDQRVDSVDDDIPPADGGSRVLRLGSMLGLVLAGISTAASIAPLHLLSLPLGGFGLGMSLCVSLACFLANYRRKHRPLQAETELLKMFNLPAEKYRLLHADLFGNRGQTFRSAEVLGVPHAVFCFRDDPETLHVGMVVAATKGARDVPEHDLYRLTLHMGLIKQNLETPRISGTLRYADKVVRITHSDALYRSLLRMASEFFTGIELGRAVDGRSLRERWDHLLALKRKAGSMQKDTGSVWPQRYIV